MMENRVVPVDHRGWFSFTGEDICRVQLIKEQY